MDHKGFPQPDSANTALITGASEGIGLELARIMAADGWNLILTARREPLLAQLAQELVKTNGIKCAVIPADLSQPRAPDEIVRKLDEHSAVIGCLVNNAGFGLYQDFALSDPDTLDRIISVNISALTRLTRLMLPGMIERRCGRILNVGSLAGFQPLPSRAVYSAAKSYVILFSRALAAELSGSGVTVTCLCPGITATGFRRVASLGERADYPAGTITGAEVARIGYRAMMKGRGLVTTGGRDRVLSAIARFLPGGWVASTARRIGRYSNKGY